jgi:hypothetical protein
MTSTDIAASDRSPSSMLLPRSVGEALLHVVVAFALIGLSISAFVISTIFGVAVTFLLTLGLCIVLPASMPIVIITAFMFQNMIIAMFTPMVPSDDAFDSLRGANFVVLMTAYGAFLIASFQVRLRAVPQLRPWLLAGFGLLGMICFYLGLGAINGDPKDAIVYFRNTVSPLACFHIAVVAASLYRIDVRRSLLWLGSAIVVYGYLELFFTLDFLSLFNGNLYIERNMRQQIETGVWEKALQQTGFVFRGLEDAMTTTFFNTPFFGNLFPSVFRIGGPNFHPISFAYALSVISVFLLFRGKKLLPLAALPLLLIIGSKGAMALLLLALFVKAGMRFLPTRTMLALFLAVTALWITVAVIIGARSGDFHVLGFLAGIRDFFGNPLGRGLGLGGNLSSTSANVNWDMAQASGATEVPMESAVGVMLYQMGICSFIFFGFLATLATTCRRLFLRTGDETFLFAFVSIIVICANAVLQEEAFFSPLALGFCLMLVGLAIGSHWRENSP